MNMGIKKLLKFHHFGIEVSSIERSWDFYVRKLGCTILSEPAYSKEFNETYAMIDFFGVTLELITSHEKQIDFSKPALRFHIALETNDFESLIENVKRENIAIAKEPVVVQGDVKLITLYDPDQNLIDIGQRLV